MYITLAFFCFTLNLFSNLFPNTIKKVAITNQSVDDTLLVHNILSNVELKIVQLYLLYKNVLQEHWVITFCNASSYIMVQTLWESEKKISTLYIDQPLLNSVHKLVIV